MTPITHQLLAFFRRLPREEQFEFAKTIQTEMAPGYGDHVNPQKIVVSCKPYTGESHLTAFNTSGTARSMISSILTDFTPSTRHHGNVGLHRFITVALAI